MKQYTNSFLNIGKCIMVGILFTFSFASKAQKATTPIDPQTYGKISTDRLDGRFISSRGIAQAWMKRMKPAYSFDPSWSKAELANWRSGIRQTMQRIMHHPDMTGLPAPRRILTKQREGYRIEKWEAYPLPESVTSFLLLIPDGTQQAPAVLCIPGSGQSKESLAGEASVDLEKGVIPASKGMALQYVRAGLVAVAVDNPAIGEASDLELLAGANDFNYDNLSRCLLECGWSYLGYASYTAMQVLEWMKCQPFIRNDRIIVSGFSLGTEPLMVLGALDPTIYAFVYNDFLCRTLERAIVLSQPDEKGERHFPNSIRHLIPGFLPNFDFPDLVASLSPRPLICTEGGMDRDLKLIQKAYETEGVPGNVRLCFYPKEKDARYKGVSRIPEGISRAEFFQYVDAAPSHYFKGEIIIPWLMGILQRDELPSH